ncbi:MAG: carboxylesterase family protein [Caulobacteraceae bacterium]|nr:carboxylesterase family protein [Caulobacteraceae bacterium]
MAKTSLAGLLFAALLAVGGSALADDGVVRARIDTGVLVGRETDGLDSFKNVPFAAPPVGALRWAPPKPAAGWSGERDAGAFGAACPQEIRRDGRPNGGGYAGPTSEDCLNLNIYAPKGAKGAPVMVWIYGGANIYGANSLPSYDGTAFARDGIVLVEINYRLGPLGFFAHPALTKTAGAGEPLANYGLMDQIAGLAWVKRNIRAFGGDPDNVTVFGESAGGIDILALFASPKAKGLFNKAIVESGGGWFPADTLAKAEAKGVALAQQAGLPADATAAQLRGLPVETLVATRFNPGPMVDGQILPQQPEQAFAKGEVVKAPLVIGSNSFEASLMQGFGIDPKGFMSHVAPPVKVAYAKDAADDVTLAHDIFTDGFMGAPARWLAGHNAERAPTWLYYFSYVRVARRSQLPGANHASEIPYVFDSQATIPYYAAEVQDEDRALAKTMHACWVAFAKTGAPACPPAPAWPAYDASQDQLMEFGQSVGVRQHLRKPLLDAVQAEHEARQGSR